MKLTLKKNKLYIQKLGCNGILYLDNAHPVVMLSYRWDHSTVSRLLRFFSSMFLLMIDVWTWCWLAAVFRLLVSVKLHKHVLLDRCCPHQWEWFDGHHICTSFGLWRCNWCSVLVLGILQYVQWYPPHCTGTALVLSSILWMKKAFLLHLFCAKWFYSSIVLKWIFSIEPQQS